MPRGKKRSSSQRASTKGPAPPISRGSAKRGRRPTQATVTLTPTVQNDDSDRPELTTAEPQSGSSPLTKDDIPSIVRAVLEHLPTAQRPSSSMATDNSTTPTAPESLTGKPFYITYVWCTCLGAWVCELLAVLAFKPYILCWLLSK